MYEDALKFKPIGQTKTPSLTEPAFGGCATRATLPTDPSRYKCLHEDVQAHEDKQDRHRRWNSIGIVAVLLCTLVVGYCGVQMIAAEGSMQEMRQAALKVEMQQEQEALVAAQRAANIAELENIIAARVKDVQIRTEEITQIAADEGFRKCMYDDSRGLKTIGFGHLVLTTDSFQNGCIGVGAAIQLLRKDYDKAAKSVAANQPWAVGEVRLILINMTYQLGATGLSRFKVSLKHLQDGFYDEAAIELLESAWYKQTPHRAERLALRVMSMN